MTSESLKNLRILQIEDDPADAELIQAALRPEFPELQAIVVDSEASLIEVLQQREFDVVLADYRLPSLNGADALRIVHDRAPDLPFILVTGTVGEETAVEILKLGATDFILKDRIGRLPSVIQRTIEETNKVRGLRKAEQALRESEEKYRSLVEKVPAIVYIAEPGHSGKWHYVSPQIESILGFTPEEWMNNPQLWIEQILPEDRQHALSSEVKFQSVFTTEYRMTKKTGEIAWFRDEAISVKSNEGVVLIHGLMIDITDLKNAEAIKLSLDQKLLQIQKIETVGQLAGGVAHDFNNILMVITSYCEILQLKLPPDDPNLQLVGEIRGAAEKGAALSRQLLTFSRKQKIERRTIDLNELITGMEQMLHHLIREDIELSLQLSDQIPLVRVDPVQIERLIINLVINARDAMPHGGRLLLTTMTNENLQTPDAGETSDAILAISDTGTGMDQETLAHIFEPFFTTKEAGKGTGLGLSTTQGIVKQNGGRIEVLTQPGAGTTFRVMFPAASAE